MKNTNRLLALLVAFAALAAVQVLSYRRGNAAAWEVAMSYEIGLQLKIQECIRVDDSACLKRELAGFLKETDGNVAMIKEKPVSKRMREMIAWYESERAKASNSN